MPAHALNSGLLASISNLGFQGGRNQWMQSE